MIYFILLQYLQRLVFFTLICLVHVLFPFQAEGGKKTCCKTFFLFSSFITPPPLCLAAQALFNAREAEFQMCSWKDLKQTVSIGAWPYALTGPGRAVSLTEPRCLRPEYSPMNEPSSLNSPSPSA